MTQRPLLLRWSKFTEEESVSEPSVSQEPESMDDEEPEVDTQADDDEDGE